MQAAELQRHAQHPWSGRTVDRDFVVVADPDGEFWEGSLVDAQRAAVVNARGGAALPCDPRLFKKSGVGGFAKRAWGAGWPLDYQTPTMCCPLTIWVELTHKRIYWAARLVPKELKLEAAKAGTLFTTGFVRLIGMQSQHHGWQSPVQASKETQPVSFDALGKPDERCGWTVGGEGTIHPQGAGFYDFALYGMMPDVRVVWLAASIAHTGL